MHWAYGGRQRQRQLMLLDEYLLSEPGYGPEGSQIQLNMSGRKGRKEALQKKKATHYEAMTNDT